VKRALVLTVSALAFTACGKLQDFGGAPPPLFTVDVTFSGDLTPLLPPADPTVHSPQVALVWGAQWLTEPFCILPPETAEAAAVIAAGCRDRFGFVPARVGPSVPAALGAPATLSLSDLPTADLFVGGITGRVAYATLIAYDDRNDNQTLDLSQPHQAPIGKEGRRGDDGANMDDLSDALDVIYGVSFLTMTEADQRVAYLEGAFDATSAFYPRFRCDPPPVGFSILGAGGFTAAGLAATANGATGLPAEDPTMCTERPSRTMVDISARPPADVVEVGCVERADDSSSRYHEPPDASPDLSDRVSACVHLPSFEAAGQSSLIQLVVSGRATDRCKGLTHYTLRGCREDVSCPVPDWDITASPPSWWPCH
jgi:hypothetical protein